MRRLLLPCLLLLTSTAPAPNRQRDLAAATVKSELLREQLASKDVVIAAKDETITLLRATYNRPN